MKISEAIEKADSIRPNTVRYEDKKKWLLTLEAEMAELMEVAMPQYPDDEDTELLMPSPSDEMYPLYLLPYIDFVLEESDLYQMDSAMSEQAVSEARRWYRRHNSCQAMSDLNIEGVI
jgi:hypothetical protein